MTFIYGFDEFYSNDMATNFIIMSLKTSKTRKWMLPKEQIVQLKNNIKFLLDLKITFK